MKTLILIIVAIVHGITEMLPISSSAHIMTFYHFLLQDPMQAANLAHNTTNIILHSASTMALLFYFRYFIVKVINNIFHELKERNNYQYIIFVTKIIMAILPGAITGLLVSIYYPQHSASFTSTGIYMALVAVIMLFLPKNNTQNSKHQMESLLNISFKAALIIGAAQIFAFLPGASRMAVTSMAAIFMGYDYKTAINFSFLISIPMMLGALFLSIIKSDISIAQNILTFNVMFTSIISFVCSIITIKIMFKIVNNSGFLWFAIYRILLAIILLKLGLC